MNEIQERACARCGTDYSPRTPLRRQTEVNISIPVLRASYCQDCAEFIFRAVVDLLSDKRRIGRSAASILINGQLQANLLRSVFIYQRPEGSDPAVYFVTPEVCTCRSGQYGILCKHRISASVLGA